MNEWMNEFIYLFKQVSLFSNKAGINEGPVFKIQLLQYKI